MFFFFQAEDGIRDRDVTGVQTCALPIWRRCGGRFWRWSNGSCSWTCLEPPDKESRSEGHGKGTPSGAHDRGRRGRRPRSEERRVGKEGRSRWLQDERMQNRQRELSTISA